MIRITGNGEVRLAGHPVAAVRGAPSQGDLRADVRSSGMAICAAFGVDPAGAPAPPELSPGLVVAIRSMASGAMGPAVDRAMGSLREMAGPLLAPDRQSAAQSELALRAGGRQMPSVTPFIPGAEEPAAAAPTAPAPAPPAAPPAAAPAADDARPSRPVSYDAPPRQLDTYSPAARPVETYSPPSAYQTASSLPVQAPAPDAPAPEAPPAQPPASEPPPWDAAPAGPATTIPPPEPGPQVEMPAPAPAPVPAPPPWEQPAPAPQPAPWESSPPAPQPSFASTPPAAAPPEPAAPPVVPVPIPIPMPEPEPGAQVPTWEPAAASAAPAPAEPAAPVSPSKSTGEWSPVATGSWTPGPSHRVSSSEWTGESTPVPAPVPEEFKEPARPAARETASGISTVPRAAAPAPSPAPATRKTAAAARRPALELRSERPRWLIPAAIGVVVLLLLGGAGVYLASRGGTSTTTASNSPHPTASPKASPSPTNVLQQIPVYAPSNAAPIKSAQFCTSATPCVAPGLPNATDTNCTLGGRCSIDVGIFYSPPYGGPVNYVLKFFDRCTGTTTDLPGRASTAGNSTFPKFSVSEISTNVTLPSGAKSAALVAVTQQPAVVASAPLLLGANSC